MPVMVLDVVAVIVQGMQRLMGNLPAGSSTPRAVKDVTLVHASVRHPTAGVHLGIAQLPGLEAMGPHVRRRFMKWHVMDPPTPLHHTRDTVMSCLSGDASGVRRPLHWVAQQGVIAVLDPEKSMPLVGL